MKKKKEITICLASSSGGHFEQLMMLKPLIEKYSGKRIPSISGEYINSADYELDLIEPNEMVEICNKILSGTEVDEVCMRDRIERFKELSEEGYYLAYDIN